METSLSHFRAGRLAEAIEALGIELRKQPASERLRVFLFELLCFAGQFDRAEKQLDVLVQQDAKAQLGAGLYMSLLRAHRQREELFAAGVEAAVENGDTIPVRINGEVHASCEDEDLRVGCALEIYAGGKYTRIPYRDLERVEIEAPKTLRDLFWVPAKISVNDKSPFAGTGPMAHLPALAPNSWRHKDDAVRLGRMSVIEEGESGMPVPYGAKLLICGDQEVPLLEVRELAFVAG
jgi:type VI secretion system protein ImpE